MTTINQELARKRGDRHLRQGVGNHLGSPDLSARYRVRLCASKEVAATVGGQHSLWILSNLLARQFGVISELEIDVPRVPLLLGVALFGAMSELPETLLNTAKVVAGAALSVELSSGASEEATVEVVVGKASVQGHATYRVGLVGDGWNLFVGNPERMPSVIPLSGGSLGPYFAACIAAGEVFKRLCGLREGRGSFTESLFMSLWNFQAAETWDELPLGQWPVPLILLPFYLAGLGAVGQAVIATLAASSDIQGYITGVDADVIDDTNLNRYPLATQNDIDRRKSELFDSLLGQGIKGYGYFGRWEDYIANPSQHHLQREDLRELERQYRYELVLSCVDKNPGRHAIQSCLPEYILGASTLGLGLAVALYDMHSPHECLKCFNPIIPEKTLEEIATELGKLSPEERAVQAKERGADISAIEAHLREPKCGQLGEQELAKFQARQDWSVGFVSVAAGVLLAAQTIKFSMVGPEAFPSALGNTLRFSFLKPGPFWSSHLRRQECDCVRENQNLHRKMWP